MAKIVEGYLRHKEYRRHYDHGRPEALAVVVSTERVAHGPEANSPKPPPMSCAEANCASAIAFLLFQDCRLDGGK
jgi:hypothetical protein